MMKMQNGKTPGGFLDTLEIFDRLLEGVQVIDREWRYIYLNPAIESQSRRPNQELLGKRFTEIWPGVETTPLYAALQNCLEESKPARLDNPFQFPDGSRGWFRLNIEPVPEGILIFSYELTEIIAANQALAQTKRLYATLSQVNQAIVRIKDPQELYCRICEIAVQYGEYSLAWIGLLDADTGDVRMQAASGMDISHWPFPVFNLLRGPYSEGLAATCIRTNRVLTSRDIQTDARTAFFMSQSGYGSYHSLAALPISIKGKCAGVLSLISTEIGLFDTQEEAALLDEMKDDICFALDAIVMEAEKIESDRVRRQWADAFDQCSHGIAIGLPGKEQILTCNQAFARLQNRTVQEISAMPILGMYAPQDHDLVKKSIFLADKLGKATFEARMLRSDGVEYPVQMDLVSVKDEDGKVLYRVATQQDISERRRSEAQLRESEGRLRSLYDHMTIGVYRASAGGETVFANPALVRLLGFRSYEEMLQYDLKLLFEAPEIQKAFFQRLEREGSIVGNETTWKTIDGRTIYVRESAYAVRDKDNRIVFYEGTVEDVTQRRLAEGKLLESERTLKTFVEYAPAAIAMFDTEMRYLAVSRRFVTDFRLDDRELVGLTHYDTFPELNEKEKEIHRRCLAGATEKSEAVPFRRIDGSLDWVRWEIHPWYKEPDNIGGIILFAEVVTEKKLAREEIQQKTEDLLLINALNDAANRGVDIRGISDVFAEKASEVFKCSGAAIYLLSEDAKWIETVSINLSGKIFDQVERILGRKTPRILIPLDAGSIFKQILEDGQGVITSDPVEIRKIIEEYTKTTSISTLERKAIQKIIPRIDKLLNIRSIISIPLFSFGKPVGILGLYSRGQFSAEDLRRTSVIGQQMTVILLRRKAEERVNLQLGRLRALSEIDRIINSSLDMQVSLDALLGQATRPLGADAATIMLFNPSNLALEFAAGKGFKSTSIRHSSVRLGEGLSGRAGLERKMLHIPDLAASNLRYAQPEIIQFEGFQGFIGMPLIAKGELKGVLEILQRSPLNPDREWLEYLESLAGQAAIAIENIQMVESLQKSNFDLIEAYDATIEGWSRAMDLRDEETEGHTQRVAQITLQLAQKMGFHGQDLVHIRRGALLHDIGKLGVPDRILLKPSKLTPEEWEIMKRHPEFAFEMLNRVTYLRPALDIPYLHHERWDGSGYPLGLTGENIPLAARIFAVVDVWDALLSDRPYRARWDRKEALEYIRSQAGKQFDPEIVEIFLDLVAGSTEYE